jgi:signal transduction histidine kinase
LGTVDVDVAVFVVDGSRHVIGGVPTRDGPWRLGSIVPRRSQETTSVSSFAHVDRQAAMLVGEAGLPADLPGWRIIVAEPLRTALAPAYRTAVMLGTTLGLTLLGALGLAVWAARRVTEPLAELTQAAVRIGRGGASASPVVVRSRDEIGMLARAFNRMHVDLQRAEQELVDAAKFAFVGELAAGVAHEVRTPLGVMRSATQLIERSLETRDERVRELAHLLRDEVDRIERVVSELLQLARPRALRVEPCAIGQVVFRAADFVETQASEKKIRVCRSARSPDPVALCDPDLVYQVALNLLVNAVQVLPEGGTIEVGVADPVDGLVGFFVRDDGPGLAPDVRERMFEPFFTRRDGGVGLGLTFVRRVVHEHRGRVHVESEPGHGVAFRVHLPAASAA